MLRNVSGCLEPAPLLHALDALELLLEVHLLTILRVIEVNSGTERLARIVGITGGARHSCSTIRRKCAHMSHLGRSNALGHRVAAVAPCVLTLTHHGLVLLDVQVVVALVSPEVLRARQTLTEQAEHSEDRVRRYLLVDLLELLQVNSLLTLEANVEDLANLVQRLHALLEVVETAAFLREHTLLVLALIVKVDYG